jgi:glutathione S-transferase
VRHIAFIATNCCNSEPVEALGWYQREDKDNATGNSHEWYYHWKAEELTRTNPSGLVPTLLPYDAALDTYDEAKAVYESLVVIDYIDAMSGAKGADRLVPVEDPYLAARCRIWTDKVNRECCSPY